MAKEIHNFKDARKLAKRHLPWMVFDYFDGAAGEGLGDTLNQELIREIRLQTRVLRNVTQRSAAGEVFGEATGLPFGVAPMGMCNLAAPGADLMLARYAAQMQTPVGVSTAASTALEPMIEAAEGHAWFQLYFGGDQDVSDALVRRAEVADYKELVLTVDVPEVGRRPRELRRGFKMPFKIGPKQFMDFALHPSWSCNMLIKGAPELANFDGETGHFDRTKSRAGADWSFFKRLRDTWQGKLVVKGVLHTADALKLQELGADAIQVSSHGGRQLESVPSPILALQSIREALGVDFPLFYDSGLRSGEDIIKAYAMGADFVFLGRPLLFAISADGERGLNAYCDVVRQELDIALAQLGLVSVQEIGAETLVASEGSIAKFEI